MVIASITNSGECLIATLSRRSALIHLTKVGLFCVLCLAALFLALSSSGGTSPLATVEAQPLLLVLVLPSGVLLIATVQLIYALYLGQAFIFDRRSNSIQYNSRRIAALSSLKGIQVRRPAYSAPNKKSSSSEAISGSVTPVPEKLRSMPEHLRLWEWPSIWLLLDNHKPIRVLDTTHLMPIPVWPFKVRFASQLEVERNVVSIATEIAEYTGVALYDETTS